MQLRSLCPALAFCALSLPAHAQISSVEVPAKNWVGAWAGMYTTIDQLYNPDRDAAWQFGDNVLAFGGGFEREFSQGLRFGVEGSYASTEFKESIDNVETLRGDATIVTGFLTGRLQGGGSGNIAFILRGALGTFGYKVPEAEKTDFDLALSTGAGIEYRLRPRLGLFLEWNQYWAYHEKGDIDESNTGRHSLIRAGARAGF